MQDFSHTQKLFVIVLAVTMGVSVLYGYAVFDIFKKNQETKELEEGVRTNSIRETVDRSTRSTLSATKEGRAALDALFLKDDEVVDFIEHLESFSSVTGASLDIRTIEEIEAVPEQGVYNWLQLSIVAEGSWQEVYHVLSLFENLPVAFLLDVANMRVRGEGSDAVWSGRFDLRVAKKKMP